MRTTPQHNWPVNPAYPHDDSAQLDKFSPVHQSTSGRDRHWGRAAVEPLAVSGSLSALHQEQQIFDESSTRLISGSSGRLGGLNRQPLSPISHHVSQYGKPVFRTSRLPVTHSDNCSPVEAICPATWMVVTSCISSWGSFLK